MVEQVASRNDADSQDAGGFLAAATKALAKLPSQLWRTGNERSAASAAGLDALAVQLDCARVGQAESRAVVDQPPAPTAAAWLLEHSLHREPAEASRTAKLSHLCAPPKNQIMAAAVSDGTVTVRKAMTALGQLAALEHDLAPGGREQALGWLTVMAQTGHKADVIAVGRQLMALVGADRALEHGEDMLRTLNSLRLSPLENGMTAISGHLDPEAAAAHTAALDPLDRAQPLHRERRTRPTPRRPAPRRSPHRDLPAHQCRRRPSTSDHQSPGRRPDRLLTAHQHRPRRRNHPDRRNLSPPRPSASSPATPPSSP